jgi:acyl-CoA synthetase (AMP-forming)/AMP-acid ligase II
LPKIQAIINDAQPLVTLTREQALPKLEKLWGQLSPHSSTLLYATDHLDLEYARQWTPPPIRQSALAYLQYTSGSTAAPKGVMISHENALRNIQETVKALSIAPDSILLSWLPHFHDFGLVFGILQPIYSGVLGLLLPPVSFIQRPIRWLQAVSRYKVTHSGGPNFAYDLCLRKIKPQQCTALDLSAWRVAVNGAEPICKGTMERFAQTFEPNGFHWSALRPAYGLAEATLKVTFSGIQEPLAFRHVRAAELEQNRIAMAPEDEPGTRAIVGCGRPAAWTKVEIVHPELLRRCAPYEVGEIWISGPCVAQGYWNRPDQTEQTFSAYMADTGEGPFLRTGDLGFMKNGELFVTGRLKDLIIIAGRNHYPQDIELTVERSHPALRPGYCAAFSIEIGDEERLVVAAELERRTAPADDMPSTREKPIASDRDLPERRESNAELETLKSAGLEKIIEAIRRAVAEVHDIQIYKIALLKTGSLPKTSSGKTQRQACRAAFLAGRLIGWEY